MNLLRERLMRGEKLSGTLVCLSDPCLCEIFGRIGYDFIWIDTEHTYLSYKDVLVHLNTAKSVGTPAIVRLPQNDPTATKKILEMGPDGIIFPMVRSAREVRELISLTLYPPDGVRGFGPMRAIGYDASGSADYVARESFDLCRFVQIEHTDCIEELEEIAKIPYIDGFIFGPNDLSGSMGKLGDVFDGEVTESIRRAIEILRRHGKAVGLAGGYSPETLAHWTEMGIDLLACGADWNFLWDMGKEILARMRNYHK